MQPRYRERNCFMNIGICVACNDRYAAHAAALIVSIRKHRNDDEEHVFYVLSDRLSEENRRNFAGMEQTFGCTIRIIDVDDSVFARWPAWRRSYAAYLRLAMGRVLPKDVSKILYLDCDMIVRTSLAPLWKTDLADNYGAAAAEGNAAAKTFSYLNLKGLYFNSGMILFNLDKYREDGLEENILRRGGEMAGKLSFPDQDLLNEAFHGKTIFVPYRWNVNYCREAREHFERIGFFSIYTEEQIREETNSPCIVHFGGEKPWLMSCFHPHRKLYWDCQRETPFYADACRGYWRSFPKLLKFLAKELVSFRVTKKRTYLKLFGWTVYNSHPKFIPSVETQDETQ